jgi:hypothetical protein
MPFGWYLASRAGPKSRRKLAKGLSRPPCWTNARIWGFGLGESLLDMVRTGEPWAKKKAGMWSGSPGRAARRSCHAGRVIGRGGQAEDMAVRRELFLSLSPLSTGSGRSKAAERNGSRLVSKTRHFASGFWLPESDRLDPWSSRTDLRNPFFQIDIG